MTEAIDVNSKEAADWTERMRLTSENEALRIGLEAAVRAATLALFTINKAGVMPNSSWESGFKKDMATANAALAATNQQSAGTETTP